MSKKIPRGKTPSLIGGSNGRPSKVLIQRGCKCYRCNDHLKNGSYCIEIPQLGGSFTNQRRVCFNCFEKILQQTRTDLETLEEMLTPSRQEEFCG